MQDLIYIDVELPNERRLIASRADERVLLSDLLAADGLPLNTRCGKRGLCEGCLVDVFAGCLEDQATGERISLSRGDPPRSIKACRMIPCAGGRLAIRIPARSLLRQRSEALDEFRLRVALGHRPLIGKGGGRSHSISAAVDIGTTTVVVLLVDPSNGRVLSRASGFNQQMAYGDDVLTRIHLCTEDPSNLRRLQKAILEETIAPLLGQTLRKASLSADHLATVAVAGHTVMMHLFAGVDPSPMGYVPFTPRFTSHRVFWDPRILPTEVGAPLPTHSPAIHLLPCASAYIGADICAGILATGLLEDEGPSLFLDIGTNGEIVLKVGDRLLGTATAAGPAFEGVGLTSGSRAVHGAIAHLELDPDPLTVRTEAIGIEDPALAIGICGSAYIDFLAELVRCHGVTPEGRFDFSSHAEARRFLVETDQGKAFRLSYCRDGRQIMISERDVGRILQAKAAIAAGVITLLHSQGLEPTDIKTVYLAGGFGMHLRVENAIRCGLLPGFRPDQIELVGNTSLGGAYLALLDRSVIPLLEDLSRRIEVIHLNRDPSFEDLYIDQMMLRLEPFLTKVESPVLV